MFHDDATEDYELVKKRIREDNTSEEEHVLTSSFTEIVTHGSDT